MITYVWCEVCGLDDIAESEDGMLVMKAHKAGQHKILPDKLRYNVRCADSGEWMVD